MCRPRASWRITAARTASTSSTTAKIGTGEGAQAYGHGLYFAGNEGVAQYLRWRSQSTRKGSSLMRSHAAIMQQTRGDGSIQYRRRYGKYNDPQAHRRAE